MCRSFRATVHKRSSRPPMSSTSILVRPAPIGFLHRGPVASADHDLAFDDIAPLRAAGMLVADWWSAAIAAFCQFNGHAQVLNSGEAFETVRFDQAVTPARQYLVSDDAAYHRGERDPGMHHRHIEPRDAGSTTDHREPVLGDRSNANDMRVQEQSRGGCDHPLHQIECSRRRLRPIRINTSRREFDRRDQLTLRGLPQLHLRRHDEAVKAFGMGPRANKQSGSRP
jgi:hypothetical protein